MALGKQSGGGIKKAAPSKPADPKIGKPGKASPKPMVKGKK
jgi:hypothetical protein